MKKVIGLILLAFVISISCCKKDKPDCEENNYGILKINYGLSSYRHSVLVALTGTSGFREKITAIGVSSDTLHLTPGTYSVGISSINASGLAIDTQNGSNVITQCNESLVSVSF
jgi:hypothetical protein